MKKKTIKKTIQAYKMPLWLRWHFAKEFFLTGLQILLGYNEWESHLKPTTKEARFTFNIKFKVKDKKNEN